MRAVRVTRAFVVLVLVMNYIFVLQTAKGSDLKTLNYNDDDIRNIVHKELGIYPIKVKLASTPKAEQYGIAISTENGTLSFEKRKTALINQIQSQIDNIDDLLVNHPLYKISNTQKKSEIKKQILLGLRSKIKLIENLNSSDFNSSTGSGFVFEVKEKTEMKKIRESFSNSNLSIFITNSETLLQNKSILQKDLNFDTCGMICAETNPSKVVELIGTKSINHGIMTFQISQKIDQWSKKYGLKIYQLGSDFILFEFDKLPSNLEEFIETEIVKICPEYLRITNLAMASSTNRKTGIEAVIENVKQSKLVFLQWD